MCTRADMARFRPPVRRTRRGYVIDLGADEQAVLDRLLDELAEVARASEHDPSGIGRRLFPAAYADDAELDAEYQRLMRPELLQSRLAAIETVRTILDDDITLDEGHLIAFMQSINALRLVLGELLDVDDDPDGEEVSTAMNDSDEHRLYQYLSWLLEWTVRALSGRQ